MNLKRLSSKSACERHELKSNILNTHQKHCQASGASVRTKPFDEVLYKRLKSSVELFDADGAADEQTAIRQMGQPANLDDMSQALS